MKGLVFLLVLWLGWPGQAGQEWRERWAELELALGDDARSAEHVERLRALAESSRDRRRARLLRANLDPEHEPVAAEELPMDLAPHEARWAARVLEPGTRRAQLWATALRDARADATRYGQVVGPAFEDFVADVEALRIEGAEILAVALHETADAAWSATSLALWSTRVGEHERARRVLTERLELAADEAETVDFLQRRAIAALGAGWLEAARDDLGHALARGGTDAAQILARLALSAGERRRAARLFGTLLLPREPGVDPLDVAPWALRGWGLALLPPESR